MKIDRGTVRCDRCKRVFKTKDNYYVYCDYYPSPSIEINWCGSAQNQGTIYFDTKELLDQAIEEAGEDNIKNYIFRVDVECVKKG